MNDMFSCRLLSFAWVLLRLSLQEKNLLLWFCKDTRAFVGASNKQPFFRNNRFTISIISLFCEKLPMSDPRQFTMLDRVFSYYPLFSPELRQENLLLFGSGPKANERFLCPAFCCRVLSDMERKEWHKHPFFFAHSVKRAGFTWHRNVRKIHWNHHHLAGICVIWRTN